MLSFFVNKMMKLVPAPEIKKKKKRKIIKKFIIREKKNKKHK